MKTAKSRREGDRWGGRWGRAWGWAGCWPVRQGWLAAVLLVLGGAGRLGAGVDEVVVVFKTHFDIGYTDMASNVVQRYRTTMIDQALKVVEASRAQPGTPVFAWTLPGWPLTKIMEDWPGQTAERREALERAFGEGRLVVHALPFTLHTELLEMEDVVRGLGYASRLSRRAGLPLPRDAKMTDVPSHSWLLPTLLRHAGVEFLHLGCNPASRSPEVPRLFWWEGPDTSRLLTMYSAESYGSGLRPPPDWPYRTWLAMIHTGDNHGPPTPAEVKKLLEEAARELPGVRVRVGRLADFADAVLAEKAAIPVVRGDMPDTWIHGPMSDPQGAGLARRTRVTVGVVEGLQTQLGAWGGGGFGVEPALGEAREQSLLYGEHTWGGALSWAYQYSQNTPYAYADSWRKLREEGRFRRLEASWEEHSSYIRRARDLVEPLLQKRLAVLAAGVGVEGPRVVVFNPLPWERSGWVRVEAPGVRGGALRGWEGGGVAAVVRDGEWIEFFAREVPAMGYRTYVPAERGVSGVTVREGGDGAEMENDFLALRVDLRRGGVTSVVDRRSGRELTDGSGAHLLGQFLYERFDADQVAAFVKAYVKIGADWAVTELGKPNLPSAAEAPYRAVVARPEVAEARRTALGSEVTMRSAAVEGRPFGVTTRIRLPEGQAWFEVEVTVHDKPADPWPEAGWICLPVRAERPVFRLGRQAGMVDPSRDLVPGANRHLFAVQSGFTIRGGDGWGLGFCPVDHAVVSLGEPGCWRYAREDFPRRPEGYVNLFNNQWTTNFRLWNEGTVVSRVRVWVVQPGWGEAEALVTPAWEARSPLVAGWSKGGAGPWPAKKRGLELSRRGVAVTAWGPNPDGPGTLLRLWEQAGQGGSCTVAMPEGWTAGSAQPVDLRGTPSGAAIPLRRGRFKAELAPHAPASWVFTP